MKETNELDGSRTPAPLEKDAAISNVTRRELLGLGASAAAGMLMGNFASAAEEKYGDAEFQVFEVKWIYKDLGGLKTKLRSYNGTVPGPLIVARPGETIRIRLKNSLTPYDSTGWTKDHNVPHDLNTTNLHVHGLDVAPHLFQPLGTRDPKAKMIHIEPGETFDYAFELPKDHPPGLYWYHPHHHGSTAVQAVSGMAGAIIIKGNIDEVPEIAAARDILLAIQDIGLFPSDTEEGVWTYEPKQNAIWQTFGEKGRNVTIYDPKTKTAVPQPNLKGGFTTGDYAERFYLLNGEPFFRETHNYAKGKAASPRSIQMGVQPIKMAPGEVVRFRVLNGCSDNLMPIVVDGHEMHLIGLDGVNFPVPRTIPVWVDGGDNLTGQVLLAPANRAEFLIQAGKPGCYAIRELPQSQQFLSSSGKIIAEIVVEGPARKMELPKALPEPSRYYPLIEKVDSKREPLEFQGMFPGVDNLYVGIDFMINGMMYDEEMVQRIVTLGTTEEWTLKVGDKDHGGTEGHPFHIHVNHFEVISINGVKQPPGTIQDTIWIPLNSEVVIRTRFKDFKGKSVYHCHILPHEDTGMMQNFLIT